MASINHHIARHLPQRVRDLPQRMQGLALAALALVLVLALGGVGYMLWPRWPATVSPDAPALPITVGGVTFNVPPAAIRAPVQRRPGAQERIDLAFLWPSLQPPDSGKAGRTGSLRIDRLFVTVAASNGAMEPMQRIKTIYPRYATKEPSPGPEGLAVLPFRDGTPFQGEDLIYDAEVPDRFLVRCSRSKPPTPGTCLHEQRVGDADITVRFPREWLNEWRELAAGIETLVNRLRPSG